MNEPVTVVIVGATGHLARTKLFPALLTLSDVRVVGTTRRARVELSADFPGVHTFISAFDTAAEWTRLFSGIGTRAIIHLAVPPREILPLLSTLAESGALRASDCVLLEKPIGTDPTHAGELASFIRAHFAQERIHCADHYLEKEAVRQLALDGGRIPADLSRIEIIASETARIEGRTFYDTVGALRDVVQNHLLETVATILAPQDDRTLPERRRAALGELTLARAKRAQYAGYAADIGHPSTTETFASVELTSNEERWRDVEITLATGKALRDKETRIRFIDKDGKPSDIALGGEGYGEIYRDAIAGDTRFFPSLDEILEAWRIIEPTLSAWATDPTLPTYEPGTPIEDLL